VSPGRPRHPIKELEALLREVERRGWHVDKTGTYFKLRCPCRKHMRWVHLTPSGADYVKDVRG
jgi:hypothetical protein